MKDFDLSNIAPEQKEAALIELYATVARVFEPRGFFAYFYVVFGMELPEHINMKVIPEIFKAFEGDRGIAIELFRGAAKTTTVTVAFTSWLIGLFPDKAFLFIQASDDSARKNAQQVADIIDHNEGFKKIFPHVVPDKELGWSANGYEVKMTHTDHTLQEAIPYDEWRKYNAKRNDQTLLGAGYKSSAIIGRRPWYLLLDDINDDKNTVSERELKKVRRILTDTIFPAANQSKFRITISTPWNKSDVLHYCLNTDEFDHIKIPVFKEDGTPTWPEMYDEKTIEKQRKLYGDIGFARMYLLDLSAAEGLVLKAEWLRTFPHMDILKYGEQWPTFIGIDYTSTKDPSKVDTDYFALAVCKISPAGHMIIVDGVYQRMTQADAETTALNWALRYPYLVSLGVEAVLSGNEFYNMLSRSILVENGIAPIPLRGGPFSLRKGERYEKQMAPAFQRGKILLSDEENKFLRAFREEWLGWQGDKLADTGHDDALDAVFNCYYMALPYLSMRRDIDGKPTNPLHKQNARRRNKASAWSR